MRQGQTHLGCNGDGEACESLRWALLYRRTGVTNQRGLIAWGLEHGLLRTHDLVCQLR